MAATNTVNEDERAQVATRLPTAQRFATAVGVFVFFLGLVVAIFGLWGWGVSSMELLLLLVMYTATGLGVTVGYHRLFAHRSFEAVGPVRLLLAVLGSMAVQGPVLKWVAVHRRHHQHSNRAEDLYSPHHHGGGLIGVIAGFWHAHAGWISKRDYRRDCTCARE